SGNQTLAIHNANATLVDASGNWWGTNTAAGVAAKVSANVDYTPWLNLGTDTDLLTDGFQGDFSSLHVDDDSPQAGSIGRIQEAVNLMGGGRLVGGGRVINVEAGTYKENDNVNKSVQILGPNAAISGNGVRGAEAIVVTDGNQFLSGTPSVGTTNAV